MQMDSEIFCVSLQVGRFRERAERTNFIEAIPANKKNESNSGPLDPLH